MSLDILKNRIKENNITGAFLFYGQEEYLKKYYMDRIEKIVLPDEGLKTLNKNIFEGKIEAGKIIDTCENLPVFSEKKLILVKNSSLFKSKSKKSEDDGKGTSFANYLKSLPDYVCIIFYEEEIDKRIKLVDTIKKTGLMVEFPFQKPAELTKWVIKVFSSYKKQIDPVTAGKLVENSEQGMQEILTEIEKLVSFTGERAKITSDDIEKVCIKSVKSRIFDLTDAICAKNKGKSFKILEDMISIKEPIPKILYMLAGHFENLLKMRLFLDEGIPPSTAVSKMGISPYAAGKIQKQCAAYSASQLKKTVEQILKYDIAVKTGQIKDRTAVEMIIMEG